MSDSIHWSVNVNPLRLSPTLHLPEMEEGVDRTLLHLKFLGADFVRLDLLWAWLEPSPGQIQGEALRFYSDLFERLSREGFQIMAILYTPPDWAQKLSKSDPNAFLECWRSFCRLVAKEFGGQLRFFQVWNEPNNYFSVAKGDFNLFKNLRLGGVDLAVGVRWDLLGGIFRIAREELETGSFLIFNVLANLSNFLPLSFPSWVDWDEFTERMLMEAGDCIDAIAIDHYPGTWTPGCSPLEWTSLDILGEKVNDPKSRWYRKTVMIGETGYSSCNNVNFGWPKNFSNLFRDEHTEENMVEWYACSLPHLARQLRRDRFPHNKINLVNLYELYDAPPTVTNHSLLKLEQHFGLVRTNDQPKLVYPLIARIFRGEFDYTPTSSGRLIPPYIQTAWGSKWVHRALWQRLVALAGAIRK
ncbi:MAG TPA: family 1 glycosylhydrolase [Chroococcales cyanobacterium]